MKFNTLAITLLLFLNRCFSQDTVFYQMHHFSSPVNNVIAANNEVFVKAGENLFKWKQDGWEKQKLHFSKQYVLFNNGFVESDYLYLTHQTDISNWNILIPQLYKREASTAVINNQLFLAIGGSLFEYRIYPYYQNKYPFSSVRTTYFDDAVTIVGTYNGIFINDTTKLYMPGYTNGYIQKINNRYFIVNDNIYEIIDFKTTKEVFSGSDVELGNARKLIQLANGELYQQNTRSINRLDTTNGWKLVTLEKGQEITDTEAKGNHLYYSTEKGEIWKISSGQKQRLFTLGTAIWDIYFFNDSIFLGTETGVCVVQENNPSSITWKNRLRKAIQIQADQFNHLWISTYSGLYIQTHHQEEPIAVVDEVEFNKRGLSFYGDKIYAGSIKGLFILDTYLIATDYLPNQFNRITNDRKEKNFKIIALLLTLFLSFTVIVLVLRKKLKKVTISPSGPQEKINISLSDFQRIIIENRLVSVEQLAAFLKTNTVQLHRNFKKFDTTPGKFLKKVKLEWSFKLLKEGQTLEEISQTIGYSPSFLKNEWQLHKLNEKIKKKATDSAEM